MLVFPLDYCLFDGDRNLVEFSDIFRCNKEVTSRYGDFITCSNTQTLTLLMLILFFVYRAAGLFIESSVADGNIHGHRHLLIYVHDLYNNWYYVVLYLFFQFSACLD